MDIDKIIKKLFLYYSFKKTELMFYKSKNFVIEKKITCWDKLIDKSSDHWFFSSIDFNYFHIEFLKELDLCR